MSNVRTLRRHPDFLPTHELKCWPGAFDLIRRGVTRATARRVDDRRIEVGDRLVFVVAAATGVVLEPRTEIEAVVTHMTYLAGPLQLFGRAESPTSDNPADVPMALVHFHVPERRIVDVPDGDDFRKILSFAASAGDTIEVKEALEIIRGICRQHLFSVRGTS